jgi:hypothetical protein
MVERDEVNTKGAGVEKLEKLEKWGNGEGRRYFGQKARKAKRRLID